MTSNESFQYDEFKQAADYISGQTSHRPEIGLILGSGLSPLAEEIEAADKIPYQQIPHFPQSGVEGHAGQLVIGRLAGQTVSSQLPGTRRRALADS